MSFACPLPNRSRLPVAALPELALAVALALASVSVARADNQGIESVLVIGTSPADTLTVSSDRIAASHATTASDLLAENVPSVFLSDTESSPFQEDVYFRGFDASPVLGTAIGLAIYQNGTRINQRFGDTVLWDVMPSFAIAHVDVVPGSDPVFGLNALGGAIVFNMKTGFDVPSGVQADASGGSFGRARLVLQDAGQWGNEAFYAGFSAMDDSGWRKSSGSQLYQGYGDFSLRSPRGNVGVALTLATDSLNENGAVPVQDTPVAAFAVPDTAQDQDLLLQTRGEYDFDPRLTLRGNAYLRSTHVETVNGQASGFAACANEPAILCDSDGDPLSSQAGSPIPSSVGGAGSFGIETISTTALGAMVELDRTGSLWGRDNAIVLGDTLDYGYTGFGSVTELGSLTLQPGGSTVHADGLYLGGPAWNVRLGTTTLNEGLYAQDTLALSQALSLDLAARFHFDQIDLRDRLGTTDTGNHAYGGLNPAVELTWHLSSAARAYLQFEQSSRTPTPAELSCANALAPCLFPLSFVSDPGLRQVVARTIEIGASGKTAAGDVALSWSGAVYGTRNENDILFETSGPFIGSGYFANVGATQRLGAEFEIDGTWEGFDVRASYGYVRATFESAFAESSPFNPAADANGDIFVRAGDRLPGIPASSAKLELRYAATAQLDLALEAMAESQQYLRGDEADLQAPLPGYAVLNAEADYRLTPALQLYVRGDNILDHRYATFGLFGDPTSQGTFPQFNNPRFVIPAEPVAFWAGVRAQF